VVRLIVLLLLVVVMTAPEVAASSLFQENVPERPSAGMGRGLYAENCAPCHGETGAGDGPAANGLATPPVSFLDPMPLRGMTPTEAFQVVKEGRMEKGMPPWNKRLNDDETWAVVAYLYDLNLPPKAYAQGSEVYDQACASCHGAKGDGSGPDAKGKGVPDLSTWQLGAGSSTQAWVESVQSSAAHQTALAGLDGTAVEDAVAYMRTLQYSSTRAPLEGDGTILGTVEMMTPGETADFTGLPVTLQAFRGSLDPVLTMSTTVTATNAFRFDNLSTDPDVVYSLGTTWEGSPYSSGALTFPPGQQVISTTLKVAAATDEDPGLFASRVHWFIDFSERGVEVVELVIVTNPGDRAYRGKPIADHEGTRASVRWPLPPGATDVDVEMGGMGTRFLVVGGALVDTAPVPPGQQARRLIFRYLVPVEGRKLTLKHPLGMPVQNITVFIAERGQKTKVSGLDQGEPQDVRGVSFTSYKGQNLQAGDGITIAFKNLPRAGESPAAPAPSTTARTIGIALAVLVSLILIAGLVYRLRQSPSEMTTKTFCWSAKRCCARSRTWMHNSRRVTWRRRPIKWNGKP